MMLANTELKKSVPRYIAGNNMLLISFVAFIPMLGLALDLLVWESAFARSGAVLVCVAIYAVYLNHYVAKDRDQKWKIYAQNISLKSAEEYERLAKAADVADPIISTLPDSAYKRLGEHVWNSKQDSFKDYKNLVLVSKNLIRTEVSTGIFGTLIWGFGDLVSKI